MEEESCTARDVRHFWWIFSKGEEKTLPPHNNKPGGTARPWWIRQSLAVRLIAQTISSFKHLFPSERNTFDVFIAALHLFHRAFTSPPVIIKYFNSYPDEHRPSPLIHRMHVNQAEMLPDYFPLLGSVRCFHFHRLSKEDSRRVHRVRAHVNPVASLEGCHSNLRFTIPSVWVPLSVNNVVLK